jgi:hypothetical protein
VLCLFLLIWINKTKKQIYFLVYFILEINFRPLPYPRIIRPNL